MVYGILGRKKDFLRGHARWTLVAGNTTGPSSYSSGGFTVTVSEVKNIEEVIVTVEGAYFVQTTTSGNEITVKVLDTTGSEITAGTDLSDVTFRYIVVGH